MARFFYLIKHPAVINVVKLAMCFFLLFFGYTTIQAYESTINANVGVAALGTLYAFFAVSNIFASYVVRYVAGVKRNRLVMGLSALTYVLFIAVHLYPNDVLLIVASIPIGIGASTLWTAQGSFLSQHGDETSYGLLAGIFFFFFALTSVLGNAFAGAFFTAGGTTFVFVIVLAIVAACNFIFIFLMKDPATFKPLSFVGDEEVVDDQDKDDNDDVETKTTNDVVKKQQSALFYMLQTLKLFGEKRMLLLVPLIMWYGLVSALWYSAIPNRVVVDDKQAEVGWLNVCFGVSNAVSSVVGGKLGDTFGRSTLICTALLLSLVGCTMALFIGLPDTHRVLPFIIAIFFGAADAVANTQIFALLSTLFASRKEAAFSFKLLVQAALTGFFFVVDVLSSLRMFCSKQIFDLAILLFVSLEVDFNVMASLVGFFGTVGSVCVVVLQFDVDKHGIER